jgi:hypothetical protein
MARFSWVSERVTRKEEVGFAAKHPVPRPVYMLVFAGSGLDLSLLREEPKLMYGRTIGRPGILWGPRAVA